MDFSFHFADVARTTIFIAASLFPIVNPLGGAPIFLSLTSDLGAPLQRKLALRIAINSFLLLMGSLFVGSHVLNFFGISLPAVQLGGGLVVAATGWAMLNQPDTKSRDSEAAREHDVLSSAFYPYTLPLTVGPGSISVAITLGANLPRQLELNSLFAPEALSAATLGSLIICLLIWLSYASAERMGRALGPSGTSVVVRLSSFILFCIGVQIAWNGLHGLSAPLLRGR